MDNAKLRDKARLLLARKQVQVGLATYLRHYAGRHLLFTAIFWLLIVVAWSVGQQAASLVIAGFWAGRLLRDIQWYRRFASEWESIRELLDWNRVERLANDPAF